MCHPSAQEPKSDPACESVAASAAPGSRRRRIWELPVDSHCPVIGVCLPILALRKLMHKNFDSQEHGDYALHTLAVSACSSRNRLAEILQRELERRYAVLIQQFKAIKDTQTLARRWQLAVEDGVVAGTFWAGLTHPQCTAELQEQMHRDMHMLQHQAGASARIDLGKMNLLIKENGVLARELGRVQERITRMVKEKTEEIRQLNANLMQVRAENMRKSSEIIFLRADLMELQKATPDLPSRRQLAQQVDAMRERVLALEGHNTLLKHQLAQSVARHDETSPATHVAPRPCCEPAPQPAPMPEPARLNDKTILCVGGRDASLGTYRELIECAGGKFEHHDGGRADNIKMLSSNLAAADLVICQTGCISHNAYWRVKEYCKRHRKPCVFVENPSASGMAKGIEALSRGEAVRLMEDASPSELP